VCADVLHYLPADTLKRGLSGLAALCGGMAFIETYTREDAIEGDMDGFHRRPAAWYRKAFTAAGLRAVGNHCYLGPALAADAAALETV
ncbi:MAG TPA: methyltransferase, partial [Xanthomonadaceae bacterium]|nr:methyltransferase [Xanthomonadaceae bacterium]